MEMLAAWLQQQDNVSSQLMSLHPGLLKTALEDHPGESLVQLQS